jgi:hypothetical protein
MRTADPRGRQITLDRGFKQGRGTWAGRRNGVVTAGLSQREEIDEAPAQRTPLLPARDETVRVKRKPVAVAMTSESFAHTKEAIKQLPGGFESSIWFALMLAALGSAATMLVTVLGTEIPDAANKGKMETAAWFCLAFAGFCLFTHVKQRRSGDRRARDVIQALERDSFEVVPVDGQAVDGARSYARRSSEISVGSSSLGLPREPKHAQRTERDRASQSQAGH